MHIHTETYSIVRDSLDRPISGQHIGLGLQPYVLCNTQSLAGSPVNMGACTSGSVLAYAWVPLHDTMRLLRSSNFITVGF